MRLIKNESRYDFRGLHNSKSFCGLRIYEEEGKPYIVVATELPDNDGTSITNAYENLAAQVAKEIPTVEATMRGGVIWVEHYPNRRKFEETFDQVFFIIADFNRPYFANPQWRSLGKTKVEELIGRSWDDIKEEVNADVVC